MHCGDYRYNDLLTILLTDSFRDKQSYFYNSYLNKINSYNRDDLNDNDRISYDIFKREMQMLLEALKFHDNFMPFNQFWGFPLDMGQLGSSAGSQPFKTLQDYKNWMSLAKIFAAWSDSAIIYFKKGMASGVVLPKSLVVKMIPQMKDLANGDTAKSVFFGPLRKLHVNFSAAEKDSVSKNLAATIKTYVLPSYQKLALFLQNEYLPKAR